MNKNQPNQRLKQILDREFTRLGKRTTAHIKAEFLGVDPTVYSAYINSHRPLTGEKALRFAKALRKGLSAQQIQELAEELEAAKPVSSSKEVDVEDWFAQRLGTESLLLVEFREPPAMRPFSPGSHSAHKVAAAIVGGMSYGMLFPYCPRRIGDLPAPLCAYLRDLDEALHATYWKIMKLVLDQVVQQYGRQEQELRQAADRLKLYRLKESDGLMCPGIGYRLFYFEPKSGPHEGQHWQWISSVGEELMLRKESDARALESTVVRYWPIAEYWRAHSYLPPSDNSMATFAKKQAGYRAQLKLSDEIHWTVDKHAFETVLAEYL
jgi:hypothetical protein